MSRIGSPNPVLDAPNAISVPVTTLDEVAAQRERVPSWIVMDIEGWEIAALKSARASAAAQPFRHRTSSVGVGVVRPFAHEISRSFCRNSGSTRFR